MSLMSNGRFSWEKSVDTGKGVSANDSIHKAYAEHKKGKAPRGAGYHLTNIPKGVFGEFSKIEEEFHELKDSIKQDNRVMTLIELADLMGAIEAYLKKEYNGTMSLDDLRRMMETTKRAFESGARK